MPSEYRAIKKVRISFKMLKSAAQCSLSKDVGSRPKHQHGQKPCSAAQNTQQITQHSGATFLRLETFLAKGHRTSHITATSTAASYVLEVAGTFTLWHPPNSSWQHTPSYTLHPTPNATPPTTAPPTVNQQAASVRPSVSQSISRSVDQSISRSVDQSISRSVNQSAVSVPAGLPKLVGGWKLEVGSWKEGTTERRRWPKSKQTRHQVIRSTSQTATQPAVSE